MTKGIFSTWFTFYPDHVEPEIEFLPILPEQEDVQELMDLEDRLDRMRRSGM
jgi:hypothetical protein